MSDGTPAGLRISPAYSEKRMEELTEQELADIRARCEAATGGPWRFVEEGRDNTSGDSFIMTGPPRGRNGDLYLTTDKRDGSHADYEFIAHARQDIPRLLDEVERLRRLVAESANRTRKPE